jgi:hypothetical protein
MHRTYIAHAPHLAILCTLCGIQSLLIPKIRSEHTASVLHTEWSRDFTKSFNFRPCLTISCAALVEGLNKICIESIPSRINPTQGLNYHTEDCLTCMYVSETYSRPIGIVPYECLRKPGATSLTYVKQSRTSRISIKSEIRLRAKFYWRCVVIGMLLNEPV